MVDFGLSFPGYLNSKKPQKIVITKDRFVYDLGRER